MASSNATTPKLNNLVEAFFEGHWTAGKVACDWGDGTFNVLAYDGKRMANLEAKQIRPLRALGVGEEVKFIQGIVWGNSKFVQGKIVKRNDDDKYDVAFGEAGEIEELVHRTLIKDCEAEKVVK